MNPSAGELALLDANPANSAIVDSSGYVVAVNRAWRSFAADNGGSESTGLGVNYCAICRAAAGDPHAAAAYDGILAVLDGSRDSFACEYPCDAPDRPRWFQLIVAPYVGASGRGAVVMHYDVTHPHQLARALDRAQKMEAVGRLASGFSHDLNNVLQILVANLRMLERRVDSSPQKQHVIAALRAAQQAEELIKRLLDFSRSRQRAACSVEPAAAIHRLAPLLRQVLPRTARLTLDVADGLPHVVVDPHRLEMALLNLAINARDAMTDDAHLVVSAYVGEHAGGPDAPPLLPPGRYLCLAVQDSGPGVPPGLRRHVFEPFFTTKQDSGTGLGLAMVREFARESGGDVELAESDDGARFVLWLPLRSAVSARA